MFGRQVVLDGLSFEVPAGSILAVVGPAGSGKTSLLKILATLLLPSSGRASIAGRDVAADREAVQRLIGYVPAEERSFFWRLSGLDNLLFFAALQGLDRKEARPKAEALMAELGIAGAARKPFRQYSSGMRQALAVSRGLLHEPAVLLLDEPTRSLSLEMADAVRAILRRAAARGRAVVFASHDLAEVEGLSGRIILLREGRALASGTMADLRAASGVPADADLEAVYRAFARPGGRP